ncbi:MAG: hypothetical protein LBN97_01275 [Oscillospiraceae bacterium]|jgi:hypothetical protein|nr:hypothetical protein [Oscillospiraceae bacterium]
MDNPEFFTTKQFWLVMLFAVCFARIFGRFLNKRKNAEKMISIEWNWIALPSVIIVLLLLGIARQNEFFAGTQMPERFKKDMTELAGIAVIMLLLGIYRLISARRRLLGR